jgi:type IV pilus assembly protein PilW
MSYSTTAMFHAAHKRSRGFTLIELMIAVTVGLFLVSGMLLMVQSTRNAFGNQNLLAQLQDNQRLAMTFMAEVVETAGYFPEPQNNTSSVFPAVGASVLPSVPAFAQGQAVSGTTGPVAPGVGDTVTIRYAAKLNDDVFNCQGLKNTTLPLDVFEDTFWVNIAVPSNPVLTCTVSSTAINPAVDIPLVNGVQNLTVSYGVKRSIADTGSCADTYLKASQMSTADWSAVCTINLSITFTNPIKQTGLPLTITINRVIAVMSAAGVNS